MHWALYIESWPEANLLWAAIDHALQQWARYQTQWVAQKYSMQFSNPSVSCLPAQTFAFAVHSTHHVAFRIIGNSCLKGLTSAFRQPYS